MEPNKALGILANKQRDRIIEVATMLFEAGIPIVPSTQAKNTDVHIVLSIDNYGAVMAAVCASRLPVNLPCLLRKTDLVSPFQVKINGSF